MPQINPTWHSAAGVAALLVLLAVVLRRRGLPRSSAAAQEAGLIATLFAAWQLIGTITHRDVTRAHANALTLWHAERALHLPSELAVEQAMLPHPRLVQVADAYYLYGHFTLMIVVLAWVWWRHRPQYPRMRLLLCLLTAAAFVVHVVPVAPPRLMPALGFVDVALVHGQSVYGAFGDGVPGQLLAMPSLHVGWAVFIAYVVVTTERSRWRWLVIAHPVLMVLDVAATANHWWADGAVCVLLLAGCIAGERTARPLVQRLTLRRLADGRAGHDLTSDVPGTLSGARLLPVQASAVAGPNDASASMWSTRPTRPRQPGGRRSGPCRP